MTTVERWTGREAAALRQALRLSVRGFATYLGAGVRTVANWEAEGTNISPRPEMQAALDTALARANPDAKARFERLLRSNTSLIQQPAESESAHATVCSCSHRICGIEAVPTPWPNSSRIIRH
jgi:transcriptional regulator with XRE-family HTH domain